MADRILEYGYKSAAELGVYGGRSVFPIALAIAKNNSHAVHAVDAWDNSVATSFSIDKPDDVWWEEVDLIAIKSSFLREMVSQNLAGLIKILELPSAEAYHIAAGKIVKSIDFLHIDGGHSEDQALSDARNWSTLVASGGMIVLDDIHWSGVQSADEFLAARFERVEEVKTDGTAFAAYRV